MTGHWRWGPPLALALAVVALALKFLVPQTLLPPCLFHQFTGYPCPTCGSTRCLLALASLDFSAAAAHNPLVFAGVWGVAGAAALNIGERLLGRALFAPQPILRRNSLVRGAVAGLILANWGYLVLTSCRG